MYLTKEEMIDILNSCTQVVKAVNAKISRNEPVDNIIISRKYSDWSREMYIDDCRRERIATYYEINYVVEQKNTTGFKTFLFEVTFQYSTYSNKSDGQVSTLWVGSDCLSPSMNAPVLYAELEKYHENQKLKQAELHEYYKKLWQAEQEEKHKQEKQKLKTLLDNAVKTL